MDIFSDIFEVDSQHRILRCRSCQFAIVPDSLSVHLRNLHKRLSREQRRQICRHVDSLSELAQTPTEVCYPRPTDAPISGFQHYTDGLRCDLDNGYGQLCAYICRSRQGIQEHCKTQHQWANPRKRGRYPTPRPSGIVDKPWSSNIACQTFFQQPGWLHYFQITLLEASTSEDKQREAEDDFFTKQLQDIQQTQQDAIEAANTWFRVLQCSWIPCRLRQMYAQSCP